MKKLLNDLVEISGINKGKLKELNFLKIIPLMVSRKKEVLSIAYADPRECLGFNTQEEVRIVEKYLKELEEGKLFGEGTVNVFEGKIVEEHSARLEKYLSKTYKGMLIDVDETMTSESDKVVPDDIIMTLISLVNRGIPIGIVTGRTNSSLQTKFISRVVSHPNFLESFKDKIYIYPENGAYCYRLDQGPNEKIYSERIPNYVLDMAARVLRKKILGFKDDYSITDYKLQIWPRDKWRQKKYVDKINSLFMKMSLPLVAYRSNSAETSASILISRSGVTKEMALSHFLGATGALVDEIVKIGDVGEVDSIDYFYLRGAGSFSVNESDPNSEEQVKIPLVKGSKYLGVNGTRWLLNNLEFSI